MSIWRKGEGVCLWELEVCADACRGWLQKHAVLGWRGEGIKYAILLIGRRVKKIPEFPHIGPTLQIITEPFFPRVSDQVTDTMHVLPSLSILATKEIKVRPATDGQLVTWSISLYFNRIRDQADTGRQLGWQQAETLEAENIGVFIPQYFRLYLPNQGKYMG